MRPHHHIVDATQLLRHCSPPPTRGGLLAQVEPVMKTDYEDAWDWRVENDNKPLWTRSPKDVADADYNDFFKQVRRLLSDANSLASLTVAPPQTLSPCNTTCNPDDRPLASSWTL